MAARARRPEWKFARGGPLGLDAGDIVRWLESAAGTDEVVRLVEEER